LVLTHPHEEGTGEEIMTIQDEQGQEVVLFRETEIPDENYKIENDVRIRSAMFAIDIPNIVAASKLDPLYYKLMMNEYEFDHGMNHDLIVANVLPYISGDIIVPGDGKGRWAKVWPGVGYFSDPCTSTEKVVNEDIKTTLTKHQEVKNKTFILMFCSVFMDKDDWLILSRISKQNKVLVIDTRDHSHMKEEDTDLQVSFGDKMIMRPVNNMVWESGMPTLRLYAFPHDTIMLGENIKYSSTLMSLTNPVFDVPSKYSEYFHFMRPYFTPDGPRVKVFMNLMHFLERGVEAGNDNQDNVPSYLAFAGVLSPVIQEFSPAKSLHVRTVYRYKEEFLPCLPQGVLCEVYKGDLYFIYPESETAVLTFHGQTSIRSVFNLTLQFLGVHKMEDRDWDVYSLLEILFSKHDSVGYSEVQLFSAAVERGYRGSQIEIVEAARQDPRLEEVKGFF